MDTSGVFYNTNLGTCGTAQPWKVPPKLQNSRGKVKRKDRVSLHTYPDLLVLHTTHAHTLHIHT